MHLNDFLEELKKIDINLTSLQIKQLEQYYNLLIEWNNKINLTNIVEKEDVYLKHFYDSLTIYNIIDLKNVKSLCDIGSGAGFPGLVLKIVFPNLDVTLVDSLNKRILFLNEVISKLELVRINTICIRSEDYALLVREKYDVVTARAVAKLNILLEIGTPLLKVGGRFIAMKSSVDDEIKNIDNCLNSLNLKIESVKKFILPSENSNRTLISILKIKETSKIFPRKYNIIKKRPL